MLAAVNFRKSRLETIRSSFLEYNKWMNWTKPKSTNNFLNPVCKLTFYIYKSIENTYPLLVLFVINSSVLLTQSASQSMIVGGDEKK